jgi:hypothetical protein
VDELSSRYTVSVNCSDLTGGKWQSDYEFDDLTPTDAYYLESLECKFAMRHVIKEMQLIEGPVETFFRNLISISMFLKPPTKEKPVVHCKMYVPSICIPAFAIDTGAQRNQGNMFYPFRNRSQDIPPKASLANYQGMLDQDGRNWSPCAVDWFRKLFVAGQQGLLTQVDSNIARGTDDNPFVVFSGVNTPNTLSEYSGYEFKTGVVYSSEIVLTAYFDKGQDMDINVRFIDPNNDTKYNLCYWVVRGDVIKDEEERRAVYNMFTTTLNPIAFNAPDMAPDLYPSAVDSSLLIPPTSSSNLTAEPNFLTRLTSAESMIVDGRPFAYKKIMSNDEIAQQIVGPISDDTVQYDYLLFRVENTWRSNQADNSDILIPPLYQHTGYPNNRKRPTIMSRVFPCRVELMATASERMLSELANPPSSITQGIISAYCPGSQSHFQFFTSPSDSTHKDATQLDSINIGDFKTVQHTWNNDLDPRLVKLLRDVHYTDASVERPLALNKFMDELSSTIVVSIDNASSNRINDDGQSFNTVFVRNHRNQTYDKLVNNPSILTNQGNELDLAIQLQNIHGDPPYLATRLAWLNLEFDVLNIGISDVQQ